MIDLAPEEHIILELRRHWFIFFMETVFLVIFINIPFVVLILLSQKGLLETYPTLQLWFKFGSMVWFLFVWIAFFVLWTNFYLDSWIITNKRIIDIEQYSLFNRQVSEFRIENIQNVSIDVPGFIPTVLGYGNILIETAGEKTQCTIKSAPHPEKVRNIISQLQADLAHHEISPAL